jgi:hypothetical protein
MTAAKNLNHFHQKGKYTKIKKRQKRMTKKKKKKKKKQLSSFVHGAKMRELAMENGYARAELSNVLCCVNK